MDPRRLCPARVRDGMRFARAVAAVAFLFTAGAAGAGTVEVSVSGTISSAFGDLSGPVGAGSVFSGTVVLDDAVVGVFTDNGNPTFVRNEMLYTGAVLSTDLSVDGQPVSGTGGDLVLLDAVEALAGEDNYEIRSLLDTGSLGGATPAQIILTGEYDFETFSLSGSEPLAGPPAFDPTRFNPFTLESDTGGSAFGQLDALDGPSGSTAVPALPPLAGGLVALGLAAGGRLVLGRRGGRRRSV